jgi:O-antigen ligase
VFGIWMLRKIVRRDSWLPILKPPLILGALAFLVWSFISTLWAEHRSAAIIGLISQVQLVFLALIVIDVIQSWNKVTWIARLLVIGGLIAAAFTAEQYFVQGVKRAGDGISGGINFTASTLVSTMPFAFYLIRSRAKGLWMLLGLIYIPLGIVAVIVTFSRSSYLLLALVLLAHAWLLMRTEARRGWSLVLVALSLAVFIVVPREAVNERLETISPLVENWLQAGESESAQADARAFHWKVGLEMLKDSPVFGVGFSNFGEEFLLYQFEVQGTPDIFSNPRSPHSSYVGILTELGLLGIGLYLFMLGATLQNLIHARRQLRFSDEPNNFYLVQAVYYVFIIQILYGWALNTHLNKNFWLFLGLSVVLYRLAMIPTPAEEETGTEPFAEPNAG